MFIIFNGKFCLINVGFLDKVECGFKKKWLLILKIQDRYFRCFSVVLWVMFNNIFYKCIKLEDIKNL